MIKKLSLNQDTFISNHAALSSRQPELEPEISEGEGIFYLTREYPEDHWGGRQFRGERQRIGRLALTDDSLTVQAGTLSMAARVLGSLKELLGDQIRLKETTWRSPTLEGGGVPAWIR
jgi:hypothetical protein